MRVKMQDAEGDWLHGAESIKISEAMTENKQQKVNAAEWRGDHRESMDESMDESIFESIYGG